MSLSDDQAIDELAYLRREVRRLRSAINRLTPGLDVLLKRRGFTIYKKEPSDDLLVPARNYQARYYGMLHKYSFRLLLRDVIKQQGPFTPEDVTRYAAPGITKKYLEYLVSVKLLKKKTRGYVLAKGPIKSFGVTLEWYVAEVFKREFGSEAVWGVKFKRPRVGGDYDVIAKVEREVALELRELAHYETPKKFLLIPDDFTVERGELTPTLKVKRRVVEKEYKAEIDKIYEEAERDEPREERA